MSQIELLRGFSASMGTPKMILCLYMVECSEFEGLNFLMGITDPFPLLTVDIVMYLNLNDDWNIKVYVMILSSVYLRQRPLRETISPPTHYCFNYSPFYSN